LVLGYVTKAFKKMTYFAANLSENENARETRTTVRVPVQNPSRLFQGWGPKF
jgi:hypothetical protein